MGYSYKFADNVEYGAEDINSVLNEIITSGIADVFHDGTSYNTSDLNKIMQAVAETGIKYSSGNSCKVISYSGNKVKVLEGTAFFSDGSMIKIDSDGVILNYTEGIENYVYLKGNIDAKNQNEVCCSTIAASGDIIPLATIHANGDIEDTRIFCKGKIAGFQSDFMQKKKISFTYSLRGDDGTYQDFTFDLGGYGFSHIINITNLEESANNTQINHVSMGAYDIVNDYSFNIVLEDHDLKTYSGKGVGLIIETMDTDKETSSDVWANFSIEGTILTIRMSLSNTASSTRLHSETITFLVV